MKRFIYFSLLLMGMMAIAGPAFCQTRDEDNEVLRGLGEVHVVVERLKAEIEQDGLFASTLQNDMELMLTLAGIKVLTEEECLQIPWAADLCLHVDAFKHAEGYTYGIKLSVMEPVVNLRKRMRMTATTFSLHDEVGMSEHLSEVREEVRRHLDKFIEAWRVVNSQDGKP